MNILKNGWENMRPDGHGDGGVDVDLLLALRFNFLHFGHGHCLLYISSHTASFALSARNIAILEEPDPPLLLKLSRCTFCFCKAFLRIFIAERGTRGLSI